MDTARDKLIDTSVAIEQDSQWQHRHHQHHHRHGHSSFWRQRNHWVAKVEAFAVRHRDKLVWVHIFMAVGFLLLMVVPLFMLPPADSVFFYNNFSLFANFIIWGLWFPLVFISVIFTGRSWCGLLCPLGASSEWVNRIGLKRPIPRWVRWQGTPVISFIIITILAQTIDARGFPEGVAVVFGLTFACALVLGFIYGRGHNKRAWCRHMCPIGLMLGVFSRIGAVQFIPKRPHVGGDSYTEKGVCPTMINIQRKQESRHCIECFRCVHPNAKGGLALLLRKPGTEIAQIRHHNPNSAEVWFLFLATGLAMGGFLWLILPQYETLRQAVGVWAIDHGWNWLGMPGPWWLMSVHPQQREVYTWLDFSMITGFMLSFAMLLATVLGFLTLLSSWLSGRLGADLNLSRRFIEQAYAYMPVAMVSLVIGLGSKLFDAIHLLGMPMWMLSVIKSSLFGLGMLWSLWLGYKLLTAQGLNGARRALVMLPLLSGIAFIGLAWWPAIFGI